MTRELRLDLDPWLECPRTLGPMIDPNLHSCGTVPPHGHKELTHPEPDYFTVGIKSYGRAPTFLMATGYEQVRSIAAHLAGDHVAANEVRLVLPETGVCSTDLVLSGETGGDAAAGLPLRMPMPAASPTKPQRHKVNRVADARRCQRSRKQRRRHPHAAARRLENARP